MITPVRVNAQYVNIYFVIDLIKIGVACWLLAVMISIACEDFMWWRAAVNVRIVISENSNFTANMQSYTQIGEDWREVQHALTLVGPISDLTHNLRGSSLAMAVADFIPHAEAVIVLTGETTGQLERIRTELVGLSRMNEVAVYAIAFTERPNRVNLMNFASICDERIRDLAMVDTELETTSAMLDEIVSGFRWMIDVLEPWATVNLFFLRDMPFAKPAIDGLKASSSQIAARISGIQSFRLNLQNDLMLMQSAIYATKRAEDVEQFWGNGYWRRFMNSVRRDPFLFLCLSLALLVIEACLSVEENRIGAKIVVGKV